MSFNLQLLKQELAKYGTIIQCELYDGDSTLEIKTKNSTGRTITYERIVNNFILPYYVIIKSDFREGYYKGAFKIKDV